jgi:hypothetical protein
MLRARLAAFVLCVAPLLAACASGGITPVGAHTYPPLATDAAVQVFPTEKEAPGGFEVIGLIDYVNPGKYQVLSLKDVLPAVLDKARSVGANGVIIDGTDVVKSGIVSSGLHVRARAVRVPGGA